MGGNIFVPPAFPLQLFCQKKVLWKNSKKEKNTVNECFGNKKILDIS